MSRGLESGVPGNLHPSPEAGAALSQEAALSLGRSWMGRRTSYHLTPTLIHGICFKAEIV